MPNTLTSKINSKARILSRILIAVNLSIYLVLFISVIFFDEIPLVIDRYFEVFIFVALASFIISSLLVMIFKTVQAKEKTNLIFLYFAFIAINVFVALFTFGLNCMFRNGLFG